MSDPIRPEVAEPMKDIGRMIDGALPPGFGFVLFVFDFGEGGHISYISNAVRDDMKKTLKEFMAKWEADEAAR